MADDNGGYTVSVTNTEYEKMLDDSRNLLILQRDLKLLKDSFENERKGLKRQIEGLEKDVQQRNKDIQKITVDCLKLRKDRMEMQDKIEDLEQAQERELRLKKEAQQLRGKELQQLKGKIQELTERLQAEEGQSKMFSTRCIELTNKLKQAAEQESSRVKPSKVASLVDSFTSTDSEQPKLQFASLVVPQMKEDRLKQMHSQEPHAGSPPKHIIFRRNTGKDPEVTITTLTQRVSHLTALLTQKNIETESLNEKLKRVQKQLDEANQNLGKQLEDSDREWSEVVDKLQKDMQERDNAMVEKNIQMDELKERANLKAENLNSQLKQAEKMIKELEVECGKLKQIEQQLRAKITEQGLKLNQLQRHHDNKSKDRVHFMDKIQDLLKGCSSSKHFEELKEELQHKLNLQSEYERIITEMEARLREFKEQNDMLKRQLDGSQRILNDVMDASGKKEAENAVLRADIERLDRVAKAAKEASVQTENHYQIQLSQIRQQLRKSERAQDQLKTMAKMMDSDSKDDFIDYYVNNLRMKMKDLEPRVVSRIIHDDLDEFIKKLAKEIPGKMI